MAQSQSISITYPKMHGFSPRGIAMVINKPKAPVKQVKFKSFKEAMAYLKEKDEDEG